MSRWRPYVPSFDDVAKELGISLAEAFKITHSNIKRKMEGPGLVLTNELFVLAGELAWHHDGRPAYRVSKHLALGLMDTSLDMDATLAIGSALFAVGANRRYVRPVINHKKHKRRRKRIETESKHRWTLGADIQLPRRGSSGSGSGDEDPGQGLRFSHLRQGHLRLQPSGPQSKRRYTIKYIAPMVIRPDLPRAPLATRHHMDRRTP